MQTKTNKAEIYLRQRKELLHDTVMLLNAKLNKNSIEIDQIDSKIREINKTVDVAMEVFSPHKTINEFTREEIHRLSEKKCEAIERNKELLDEIQKISQEEKQLEIALEDMEELIREKKACEEDPMDTPGETERREGKEKQATGLSGVDILEMQEMERQRIARDLHDSPVQMLTNCIHKTELCSRVIDMDSVRAKLELEILENTIRSAINEIRGIIYDLRPMAFDDLGFEASLDRIINQIKINARMNIEVVYEGEKRTIPSIMALTIVRIVQETCNNSLKHSEGKNIKILFTYNQKSIALVITDDGHGFDPKDKGEGFGLSIMKERVYLLSGKMNVETNENGTRISVEIPFDGGKSQ